MTQDVGDVDNLLWWLQVTMNNLVGVQIVHPTSNLFGPIKNQGWRDFFAISKNFVQLAIRAVFHDDAVTRCLGTNTSVRQKKQGLVCLSSDTYKSYSMYIFMSLQTKNCCCEKMLIQKHTFNEVSTFTSSWIDELTANGTFQIWILTTECCQVHGKDTLPI